MTTTKPPILDDRRWDDLRQSLIEAIPYHAPEWTERSPNDPGVALIEVFAWMAQNLLYRMNRVPEASQRKFFELLNVGLRAARPSETLVRLRLPALQDQALTVPERPLDPKLQVSAGELRFEAKADVSVLPIEGVAWIKQKYNGQLAGSKEDVLDLLEEGGLGESSSRIQEQEQLDDRISPYEPVRLADPVSGVLPQTHPLGNTADHMIWIALLAPEKLIKQELSIKDPSARASAVALVKQKIRQSLLRQRLHVGVVVDQELGSEELPFVAPSPGAVEELPELRWQILAQRERDDQSQRSLAPIWRTMFVDGEDSSKGMRQSGVIALRFPDSAKLFGQWEVDDPDMEGIGDLPPRLDDEAMADRVVTWVRAFRPQAPHPSLRWVGVNCVMVEQAILAPSEVLGAGAGRPNQQLRLRNEQILPDSLALESSDRKGSQVVLWTRVDDFYKSRATDAHYMLDAQSGTLRFGDGLHGRVPQVGEVIRAKRYRFGGGVVGNVDAGSITRVELPAGELEVEQLFDARGGRDAETYQEAKLRLPSLLRHNERAVAMQDFADLALETPGTNVGRVIVLPRHEPKTHTDEIAGVVSLVVLPAYDPLHPDEPVPDRDMLRRVSAHLQPRRLVTTELYLIPPSYRRIWVSLAVTSEEDYSPAVVHRWVELAIRQFLAPLAPYGPGGEGWPSGRTVTREDILAAVLRVEGVRIARDVHLQTEYSEGDLQDIELQRWELPSLRKVQIAEGETAEPISMVGDALRPTDDSGEPGDPGYPVPIKRERC